MIPCQRRHIAGLKFPYKSYYYYLLNENSIKLSFNIIFLLVDYVTFQMSKIKNYIFDR